MVKQLLIPSTQRWRWEIGGRYGEGGEGDVTRQRLIQSNSSLNSEGPSGAICPGGKETNHRPSGGPGAKRPGPRATDDGRDSWPPPCPPLLPSAGSCSPRPVGRLCSHAPLSWPQQRQPHMCCWGDSSICCAPPPASGSCAHPCHEVPAPLSPRAPTIVRTMTVIITQGHTAHPARLAGLSPTSSPHFTNE